MKRDEGGEIRPSREELNVSSFDDLSEGLTDVTITRSRAIKLAGAALAGSALTILWPGEADAANRKRRRRRRRRRRKAAVTSDPSTMTFGDTVVGDGFTIAPTFPGIDGFTLAPGTSIDVPVIFTPEVTGPSTGTLRILEGADDLLVETVDLIGQGIL
ncbi:MAG: hypothetical protein LC714_09325 [Actinobacteria bacterium]|nr:hypothetical protein [Actinomycetota bacterium]